MVPADSTPALISAAYAEHLRLLKSDLFCCSDAVDRCLQQSFKNTADSTVDRHIQLLEDTFAQVFASIRRVGSYLDLDERYIAQKANELLDEQSKRFSQQH